MKITDFIKDVRGELLLTKAIEYRYKPENECCPNTNSEEAFIAGGTFTANFLYDELIKYFTNRCVCGPLRLEYDDPFCIFCDDKEELLKLRRG